ncbi:MAG: hypothetical protein GY845_02165, partial [Planctomycetes bacterium]|nr:hypothetical protein [Planctomycetota bacterium]
IAESNFLQPARPSLVDERVDYIRGDFPKKAKDVNTAAPPDGHIQGYSVTTEVFANMAEAKQITYTEWDEIFTYGHASIESMEDACNRIQEAQEQ